MPAASFASSTSADSSQPVEATLFKPMTAPTLLSRNSNLTGSSSGLAPTLSASMNRPPSTIYSGDSESDLASRKQEVKDLTAQFAVLEPANEELRAKREALDAEFKQITEERNKITIKISQARALYDAESQILVDTQAQLARERGILDTARAELEQMQAAISHMTGEKERVLAELDAARGQAVEAQARTRDLQEKGVELQTSLMELRTEHSSALKVLDLNQRLLADAQQEYEQIKADVAQTERSIERERTRSTQMQSQIAVQSAISDKERSKLSTSTANLAAVSNSMSSISSASVAAGGGMGSRSGMAGNSSAEFDTLFGGTQSKQTATVAASSASVKSAGSPSLAGPSAISPVLSDQISLKSVESTSGKSVSSSPKMPAQTLSGASPASATSPSTAGITAPKTAATTKPTGTAGTAKAKPKATTAAAKTGQQPVKKTATAAETKPAAAAGSPPRQKTPSPASGAANPAAVPAAKQQVNRPTPSAAAVSIGVTNPVIPAAAPATGLGGANSMGSVYLMDLNEPPLPPQSTKPTQPPGTVQSAAEVNLLFGDAFTPVSATGGGPRNVSPSKFDDAFRNFGPAGGAAPFDFDAAFASTTGAGAPPVARPASKGIHAVAFLTLPTHA